MMRSKWFTVIMLLLFYPVGLIFLIINKGWNAKVKFLLAVLFAVITVVKWFAFDEFYLEWVPYTLGYLSANII